MAAIDPDLRTKSRYDVIVQKQPVVAIDAKFGVSDTTIRRLADGTCRLRPSTARTMADVERAERAKQIPTLSRRFPQATSVRITAMVGWDPAAVLRWRRSVGIPVFSQSRRARS